MNRLNDKVAVITGGNSGVGAATAKLFADEGAKVVLIGRTDTHLEELAKEIEESDQEILTLVCDIADAGESQKALEEAMNQFGQIDILVNTPQLTQADANAKEEGNPANLNQALENSWQAALQFTAQVQQEMEQHENASVIMISAPRALEEAGKEENLRRIAEFQNALMQLAGQALEKGIRINGVAVNEVSKPSAREFALFEWEAEGDEDPVYGKINCQPEDIANMILFLASDESQAMTGQVLTGNFKPYL